MYLYASVGSIRDDLSLCQELMRVAASKEAFYKFTCSWKLAGREQPSRPMPGTQFTQDSRLAITVRVQNPQPSPQMDSLCLCDQAKNAFACPNTRCAILADHMFASCHLILYPSHAMKAAWLSLGANSASALNCITAACLGRVAATAPIAEGRVLRTAYSPQSSTAPLPHHHSAGWQSVRVDLSSSPRLGS